MKSDIHEVENKHTQAKIIAEGKVQGVFFRSHCKEMAEELNLTGYAKNIDDGRVEIFLQGLTEYIERFIEWCWKGSPKSEVKDLKVEWLHHKPEKKYKTFETK